jgi:hypothetical protein
VRIRVKLPAKVYDSGEREGVIFKHIVGSKFESKWFFVNAGHA